MTANDTATINVSSEANNPPTAYAGPDKDIWEGDSIILNGSGSDPDGDPITYSWYCNGGSLSNYNVAQPLYTAPAVSYDTYYTCTLTVTDNESASDSDTMLVLVRDRYDYNKTLYVSLYATPSSGDAPLNNVDLTASVSGTASGDIIYRFDCTNDGYWDRTITTSDSSYTVYNVCDYSSSGTYTAEVKVEREGETAYDTTSVYVYSSGEESDLDIEKWVKNLTQNQTYWRTSVSANPSDQLEFQIKINSTGDDYIYNVRVKDILPSRINDVSNLKIDGHSSSQNILTGINLGTFHPGELQTITFKARIDSEGAFSSSNTTLTNKARTWADGFSQREDSVTINVYKSALSSGDFSVEKLVRNLSDGTGWKETVDANPTEVLSFLVRITAGESAVYDLTVKDALPDNINFKGNLKIDGSSLNGDIGSGVDIGDLSPYDEKEISFDVMLASADQFTYGTTYLTNTVLVYNDDFSVSDPAKIKVSKQAVAGAATGVVTGINQLYFVLIITLILSLGLYFLIYYSERSSNTSVKKVLGV